MDARTRLDGLDEAIQTAIDARVSSIHTAVPCTIVSVDMASQTCVLQPTLKARIQKPDGSLEWVSYPQITDAPLHFPSGGSVSITFPVQAGDEALAIIPDRSPDAWQQSGGEQQLVDVRMHDLSSAFALVGFRSSPRALQDVSSESVQIRSDDGNTLISLKGDEVTVKATNATSVVTPSAITHTVGSTLVKITGGRVDLGADGGSPVITQAGPSSKVFAVV